MKFKYEDKGKKLEFEEGGIYYITDWYTTEANGKHYQLPIIVESICIVADPNDWDYNFLLKEIRNIIPSDYPAKSYNHPGQIQSYDWDHYFQNSLEEAYDRFYAEYKEDPKIFFNKMFKALK